MNKKMYSHPLSLRSVQPLEDITDVRRLICKFLCLIAEAH